MTHEDRMFERLFGPIDHDEDDAANRRMSNATVFVAAALVVFCRANGLMEHLPVIAVVVAGVPCGLLAWAAYRDGCDD